MKNLFILAFLFLAAGSFAQGIDKDTIPYDFGRPYYNVRTCGCLPYGLMPSDTSMKNRNPYSFATNPIVLDSNTFQLLLKRDSLFKKEEPILLP